MKRIVILVGIAIFIGGCGSYNTGELVGVEGRKAYAEPDPFGMVAVPMGSFVMGASDQDVTWTQNSVTRTVAVDAFWMDETEITNNEYRQFVFWVRDSIIRKELAVQGIDDYIRKGRLSRDPEWTESLAVGDRTFVESLQDRFSRRRIVISELPYHSSRGSSWTIREKARPYS